MGTRILPAARARIIEIWNYTETNWGEQQADKYVRELVEAIPRGGANRNEWKPVQDSALIGVFFFKHARHFVFFKELTGGDIGVITILHESVDLPARLRKDSE